MQDAALNVEDVNYLNAHATSTPVGDLSETKAISAVFGGSKNLHISSTKSTTGHLLGAAGAIEAITAIKAVQENVIPPTINTEEIDPAIPTDLQIVTRQALEKTVEVSVSNTFGFGGHNGVVLFTKFRA